MDILLAITVVIVLVSIFHLLKKSYQHAKSKGLLGNKVIVTEEFYNAAEEVVDAVLRSKSKKECDMRLLDAATRIRTEIKKRENTSKFNAKNFAGYVNSNQ